MMQRRFSVLTDRDIEFLVETVAPELVSKTDLIKGDATIVEGMLEQEAGKLFQRVMRMGEEVLSSISPGFLFHILLRLTATELESRTYTVERSSGRRIPVFDTDRVRQFLSDRSVVNYLAEMLASFTRVEGFTRVVRVRAGVWRKYRFSDMDIDSLLALCETVDEESRFGIYKRIADLCLFITGMFPEYPAPDLTYYPGREPVRQPLRRLRRTAYDYEQEGKKFYRLACEHRDADSLELTGVLYRLQDKFDLAQKPLNYISDHYLHFRKQKLFPSPPSA